MPLPDGVKLWCGKKLDRVFGTVHENAGKCNCYRRKNALNDWTLRVVSFPWHARPFVIVHDFWRIISRI